VTTPILLITADHALSHEEVIAVGGQGVVRKDRLGLMLAAAIAQMLDLKLHDTIREQHRESDAQRPLR